ncbi:MAG: hypothetical protein QW265_00085 [Candidatus Bathyarchaeia archaeon]
MDKFSYKVSLSKRALELFESYPEVKAWYDEVSAKSPRTSRDYADALASFAKAVGKNPKELIKLSSKKAYSLMKGWVISELQSKSVTSGRIHAIWYGVKSFIEFHGVEVKGEFPLKQKVRYLDKIPTKEELKLILDVLFMIEYEKLRDYLKQSLIVLILFLTISLYLLKPCMSLVGEYCLIPDTLSFENRPLSLVYIIVFGNNTIPIELNPYDPDWLLNSIVQKVSV